MPQEDTVLAADNNKPDPLIRVRLFHFFWAACLVNYLKEKG